MVNTTRAIVLVAMVLLTIVSICTTYISLNDSILPEPVIGIPLGNGHVWSCSILALALSVAIGLMLYALKMAIVDGHKRLNILGIVGMTMIASISIMFNMDVLYRTADRDFFLRYSNSRMRSVYETYLAEVQGTLLKKRDAIRREVASQQGELEAEIEGLRKAPAGYGQRAKEEDYRLTVLEKTSSVDLDAVNEALEVEGKADELLRTRVPQTLNDVQSLQDDLRVVIKDLGAQAGIPLPEPVRLENPLFAVFQNLFDIKKVGMKELIILALAILLDLGDIIGYTMVPNKPKSKDQMTPMDMEYEPMPGPEFIPPLALSASKNITKRAQLESPDAIGGEVEEEFPSQAVQHGEPEPPRSIRFRRRH